MCWCRRTTSAAPPTTRSTWTSRRCCGATPQRTRCNWCCAVVDKPSTDAGFATASTHAAGPGVVLRPLFGATGAAFAFGKQTACAFDWFIASDWPSPRLLLGWWGGLHHSIWRQQDGCRAQYAMHNPEQACLAAGNACWRGFYFSWVLATPPARPAPECMLSDSWQPPGVLRCTTTTPD
jgi:hypothetical protein